MTTRACRPNSHPPRPFPSSSASRARSRGLTVVPLYATTAAARRLRRPRRGRRRRAHRHRGRRGRRRRVAPRLEPARHRRPPLRGRGARRREAEPRPRALDPRRRRLEARDPGEVRRAGPLGLPLAPVRARAAGGAPRAAPAPARPRRAARRAPSGARSPRSRRGSACARPPARPRRCTSQHDRLARRVPPGAPAPRRPGGRDRRHRRRARLPRLRQPLGRLRRPLPEAPARLRALGDRASEARSRSARRRRCLGVHGWGQTPCARRGRRRSGRGCAGSRSSTRAAVRSRGPRRGGSPRRLRGCERPAWRRRRSRSSRPTTRRSTCCASCSPRRCRSAPWTSSRAGGAGRPLLDGELERRGRSARPRVPALANRLNVAISRAQCLAYLVCSPRPLEINCRTIEQMRLANALCRFVELAG